MVTHSNHFDQRYVDLSFTTGNGVLNATAPASGNEAPPGWYMLFILNSAGVPSVASWVHVGGPVGPRANPAPSVSAGADVAVVLPERRGAVRVGDGRQTPEPARDDHPQLVEGVGPPERHVGDASALSTSATFSTTGTYVLRLTGDDSALMTSDDVRITVTDSPPPPTNTPPSVSAGADQGVVLPNSAALAGT